MTDSDPLYDVRVFHDKMGLPRDGLPSSVERGGPPRLLTAEEYRYRYRFLLEELEEFKEAQHRGDLTECVDALLDLAWVAIGTAYFMRVPVSRHWAEIARANMEKERRDRPAHGTDFKRGPLEKVVKPSDWQPPRHAEVLDEYLRLMYGASALAEGDDA